MSRAHQVRVEGKVQGVGFRWATMARARALGIRGWVRNLPDRSVEVFCQGGDDALEVFLSWLQHGPIGATVQAVTVVSAPVQPALDGFEIRG